VEHGIVEKVRALGGEIYAISSEPQTLAGRASVDWELGFETVGDPHHEVAKACRDKGWLDLFVNKRLEFLQRSAGDSGDWAPTHPKGYFQPGVLGLDSEGRVLYRWRGVPSHKNMGGATERPTAEYVWEKVARALDSDGAAPDAPLDTKPTLDSSGIPWPLFAALLIANGWFLGGRGFKSARRVAVAGLRLVIFAGSWIAAFTWLPALPVAAVLAGWLAYITPKVRWLGREFQDVSGSSH
jgi:hypothetical protein